MVTAIVSAVAALAPTIAGWIGGDKAEEVVGTAVGFAKQLTGEDDDMAAINALKANPQLLIQWQKMMNNYELGLQKELTKRHEADMKSDSWLSKNIRPACLLFLTIAITVGVFMPVEYVDSTKFKALTDMSQWVYGYYFVGRSTFDKGNIKMDFGKFGKK